MAQQINRPLPTMVDVAEAFEDGEPVQESKNSTGNSGQGSWEPVKSTTSVDMEKYSYRVQYGAQNFWVYGTLAFETEQEAIDYAAANPGQIIIPVIEII